MTAPRFSPDDLKALLSGKDDDWLFRESDRVRRAVFGNEVYIRGIIEFTNHCRQNCLYCGLRRENRQVTRYRLSRGEIFQAVETAVLNNIPTIVLQGGEDPYFAAEWIAELIAEIKTRYGVAITLSLGERNHSVLKRWRAAGADRYLLRIETWNKANYHLLRPQRIWETRRRCLEMLRELDYEVGSGIMVGLPGENLESLVIAIEHLSALNLDMIGVGPFIAHPQTPLRDQPNGEMQLSLRTLALLRIMNPFANMPATSAMECTERGARRKALEIGMNVLMPSLTSERVKNLYNIYPGKNAGWDDTEHSIEAARTMLEDAGLQWSTAKGISPNYLKRIPKYNHTQIEV